MANFLKNVFEDMRESAKAQHELDKANFAAVKAEAKAQWEEAKARKSAKPPSGQNGRERLLRQKKGLLGLRNGLTLPKRAGRIKIL